MLARIGFERVEELFAALPAGLRLGRGLKVPEGRSEQEVLAHLTALAAQNENAQTGGWFLGAGS
jgi:glycine dehydrogenase subunit 1